MPTCSYINHELIHSIDVECVRTDKAEGKTIEVPYLLKQRPTQPSYPLNK